MTLVKIFNQIFQHRLESGYNLTNILQILIETYCYVLVRVGVFQDKAQVIDLTVSITITNFLSRLFLLICEKHFIGYCIEYNFQIHMQEQYGILF